MIDSMYWYFAIPSLLLTIVSQLYVKYMFYRYSSEDSGKNITGEEAANIICDGENFPVDITTDQNPLGDHFDPVNDVVRVSQRNRESRSVADIAIVAHEFGHVQQKFSSTFVYRIRQFMVPVTNISTQIGYILFFLGLALSIFRLSEIGLVLFSSSVIFCLVTLPVELDASRRGMEFIKKYNLITKEKRDGAKSVLTAAAFTYLAGLLSSILNLLYYVNMFNQRKKK